MGFDALTGGLIGAGSSILGAVLGADADRDDRRLQEQYLGRSLGSIDDGIGALDDAEALGLADLDVANVLLEGLDEEVLGTMDESLRVRIGQQMMRDQEEAEAQDMRLAAAGLDATTAGAGIQRSRRYGQANRIGSLSAAFAGQRASALTGIRGMQAQGFQNQAQFRAGFGQARAGMYGQKAGILGNVQVAPNNVAAGIGAIGGSISNAFTQQAMIDALNGN